MTTNSGAALRSAGRNEAETRGKEHPEQAFESLRRFVLEQHAPDHCPHHEREKWWSKTSVDVRELCTMVHPENEVWDDVKGGWLPVEEVKKARREELECVRKAPLYKKVSRAVPEAKGMSVIPIRWVDTNKGTTENPVYRSRVVAMEFKRAATDKSQDHELFAPMPPIEGLRW